MYFLSIDVANKSLAISFLKYTKTKINKLDSINSNNIKSFILSLNKLNKSFKDNIQYHICEVIDLLPNKKVKNTNIIERSNALKKYLIDLNLRLNQFILDFSIQSIMLLIENQPSFNDKSKTTFNQIIYEFSNNSIYTIKVMNPLYKNLIYFHPDLKHYNFLKKYSNNYLANKNHTKENFKYFLEKYNMLHKIINIKKKNYDDIADSFMQIFAYIIIIKKQNLIS